MGNFVIDDPFHYSCNTSHGRVPFLVYNILNVDWLFWSPEREHMPIINKDTRAEDTFHVQDKLIFISDKLLFMLTWSTGKEPGVPLLSFET